MLDLIRNTSTRLSFLPGESLFPVWTPDGKQIVFSTGASNGSRADLYRKSLDVDGPPQLIASAVGANTFPGDISPDGKWLIFNQDNPGTGNDIEILRLPGDAGHAVPSSWLHSPSNEDWPRFSPDGHWVAYDSDENGTTQVYLQSFPTPGAKYQISANGGSEPEWRGDGKELYFVSADSHLMAVTTQLGATPTLGDPQPLFAVPAGAQFQGIYLYSTDRSGQRFLWNLPAPSPDATGPNLPLTVMLNWQSALPAH